ncbi:MAG TPA: hypothetical protein PLV31_03025 [Gammaproteobacteria bacterium]|nr:hypothetical protein [Gammaproteobacteria bacterium]HRA42647.1 hypothetical protein [Gammaproteobacteria bacterium]
MSTPMTEKQLKEKTQARLEALRANAQQCLDNLDALIKRQSLKVTMDLNLSEQDRWYKYELNDFYEQIKKHVENIKEISKSMQVPPTAQEIEKLEKAIDRALSDYEANDKHLKKLQADYPTYGASNKQVAQEMLFKAKQGCIKVGRMLSDLAKSAAGFCKSAKKLAEETQRISEIHAAEISPEAQRRRDAAKAVKRAASGAATVADAADSLVPQPAKIGLKKAAKFLNNAIPKRLKQGLRAAAASASEGVEDVSEALAKAAEDPIITTLKAVGANLEAKIDAHNEIIAQALARTQEVAAQTAPELNQGQEAHEKRRRQNASKETKSDPTPARQRKR